MCAHCSEDKAELERAKAAERSLATDLRVLAQMLESLARGDIKPHSEDSKLIGVRARNVIRTLVGEWL